MEMPQQNINNKSGLTLQFVTNIKNKYPECANQQYECSYKNFQVRFSNIVAEIFPGIKGIREHIGFVVFDSEGNGKIIEQVCK
jgi:hypothetical protein